MRAIKKFFKLDKHINYTDKIVRSVIKTSYAKKKLSSLLLMLITIVVRLVLDIILGCVINFNNTYLDFWLQIIISIILVLQSNSIYEFIKRFEADIYKLTKYLVNNYTDENYRKWKRNITLIGCLFLIVYLYFVQLNSYILILYVIQYLICYIIIDLIENRYKNFKSPYYGPTQKAIYTYDDNFKLADNLKLIDNKLDNPEPNDPQQPINLSPKISLDSPKKTINLSPKIYLNSPKIQTIKDKPINLSPKINQEKINIESSPPTINKSIPHPVREKRAFSQNGYAFDDDDVTLFGICDDH